MTTLSNEPETGLGSEPVYEITVEYYLYDDGIIHNYEDVYRYVTNISINNGNVFFNYREKSVFNNNIFDKSLVISEDTIKGNDSHTNIELQEIDSINIENMGY